MIEKQSGGNAPKYGPKGLGGPIAKTVYAAVQKQTGGRKVPKTTVQIGNPEKITGSKSMPKPAMGNPEKITGSKSVAKPVMGNPDGITGSKGGKAKPVTDVVKPGARPVKPAPSAPAAPSVYRAKKGDGLWQVAEKTKPAGTSTAAWWTKIKKLNSTNGKVNRTFTGTGVKLPKA